MQSLLRSSVGCLLFLEKIVLDIDTSEVFLLNRVLVYSFTLYHGLVFGAVIRTQTNLPFTFETNLAWFARQTNLRSVTGLLPKKQLATHSEAEDSLYSRRLLQHLPPLEYAVVLENQLLICYICPLSLWPSNHTVRVRYDCTSHLEIATLGLSRSQVYFDLCSNVD